MVAYGNYGSSKTELELQGDDRVSPSQIVISYDSTAGLRFISAQRVVAQ